MLNSEQVKQIREEIQVRISQLQEQMVCLKEQSKPVEPDKSLGRITRMDAIQQKSMAEANLRTSEQTLVKLKTVLTNLDKPSFGICGACGKAIPIERVLYMPEARTCVACA